MKQIHLPTVLVAVLVIVVLYVLARWVGIVKGA